MSDTDLGVQPERDPYLLDNHPLLRNAVIMSGRDRQPCWYVPRQDFEAMVKERDELRKAVALLNVAIRIKDPRVSLDVRKILDSVGQGFDQAQATGSIILGARQRTGV